MYFDNKIWWLCLVPTSTIRFAIVGYRMVRKMNTVNVANFEHFLEIPFSDTFVLNPM